MRAEPAKAAPVAQKGRAKKKKSAASSTPTPTTSGAATPAEPAAPDGQLWDVVLEDTVLFPEGGGQPWDTGVLTLSAAGGAGGAERAFAVEGVVRRGLEAVHVVRVPSGCAAAFADLAAPGGGPGREARVDVDWERRLDHMATHTGQHLLSAVLDRRGLGTLSWAMPPHPSTEPPYVELPRGLTWHEAQDVEDECNALIAADPRVWIDFSMQGSAATAGANADDERERERENRGIPKDYSGVSRAARAPASS